MSAREDGKRASIPSGGGQQRRPWIPLEDQVDPESRFAFIQQARNEAKKAFVHLDTSKLVQRALLRNAKPDQPRMRKHWRTRCCKEKLLYPKAWSKDNSSLRICAIYAERTSKRMCNARRRGRTITWSSGGTTDFIINL